MCGEIMYSSVQERGRHALPHSTPSQLWRNFVQLYNGPLRNCRKIRGKTAVQQSLSRRARRSSSQRCRMWLPRATRGQWKTTKSPQQPITQSRQHGAKTISAHLYWCGADPSCPWPAPVAVQWFLPANNSFSFCMQFRFISLNVSFSEGQGVCIHWQINVSQKYLYAWWNMYTTYVQSCCTHYNCWTLLI